MQVGLPLAAHGNSTGIHYIGARNSFSFTGVEMESLWTFLGWDKKRGFFQDSSIEATLEGEKLKISSRRKREKTHQDLWRCSCVSREHDMCQYLLGKSSDMDFPFMLDLWACSSVGKVWWIPYPQWWPTWWETYTWPSTHYCSHNMQDIWYLGCAGTWKPIL